MCQQGFVEVDTGNNCHPGKSPVSRCDRIARIISRSLGGRAKGKGAGPATKVSVAMMDCDGWCMLEVESCPNWLQPSGQNTIDPHFCSSSLQLLMRWLQLRSTMSTCTDCLDDRLQAAGRYCIEPGKSGHTHRCP